MSRILNERVLTQLVLLAVAIALYLTTLGSHQGVAAAQSPVFFPRIILGLWIGLTLIALTQDLMSRKEVAGIERLAAAVLFIVAALIYLNLVTRLGFAISSAPFTVVALLLFGIRNPLVLVAYAIAVPGVIVILFNHMLGMPLPTSPFTHLF
ncbi:MAG: tripartite tricarboxylate transporter TctB family protein [Pseudomonadota bacterium]